MMLPCAGLPARFQTRCLAQNRKQLEKNHACLVGQGRGRCPTVRVQAVSIDRRKHLELAWQRQQRQDRTLSPDSNLLMSGNVANIRNLDHLDQLLESMGSNILLVFFYSRSCGICKEVLSKYTQLCHEVKNQQARVAFSRHEVMNEYDEASDVSRFYKIKTVPTFVFFVGGAPVKKVTMRDIRRLTGTSKQIQDTMTSDMRRLSEGLREVLFRNAPSARS